MAETIRFHLDESVTVAIVRPLRARGIDVTTPDSTGLLEASDEQHLVFGKDSGRVVVTHDTDFLALHAIGASHAGIAYCHQRKYGVGEMLHLLQLLHACYTPAEMKGRVEYL